MPPFLLIMAGGAVGAALRYEAGRAALRAFGPYFPWGTLIVNLLGGFLMGLLAGVLARHGANGEPARLLLAVGVLGGFTTFSAFSLDAWNMIERGQVALALGYALISVVLSVALLFAGLMLARAFA